MRGTMQPARPGTSERLRSPRQSPTNPRSTRTALPSLMKSVLRLCWALLALASTSLAQDTAPRPADGSPEWLVETFFKQKEFPDRSKYMIGEFALRFARTPHLGATYFTPQYRFAQREFFRDERTLAIAVTVEHTEKHETTDFYVFMRRDEDMWKIEAIRLGNIPPAASLNIARLTRTREKPSENDSWDLMVLQNFKLNDGQIKAKFTEKREDYERITNALLSRPQNDVIRGGRRSDAVAPELWQQVRDLQLNYVELQAKGWVEFNIARAGESAIGIVWVHERGKPPAPTPDGYMLVEHLDGPWYFYRHL